jgi:hypothetical protein
MSDFFNSYGQAGVRPQPIQRWNQSDKRNGQKYAAVVISSGLTERLENTMLTYIPLLREYVKVSTKSLQSGATNCIGQYHPYNSGDWVLVEFLHGDTNQPLVTGSLTDNSQLSSFTKQDDIQVAQPGTVHNGVPLNPPPISYSPLAIGFSGNVEMRVYRLQVTAP